jgi:hypothetical protein
MALAVDLAGEAVIVREVRRASEDGPGDVERVFL